MLLKSIILFAAAVVATTSDASSSSITSDVSKPTPITEGRPVCAECLPCSTDCVCAEGLQLNCSAPRLIPPKDPLGRPVCAEGLPCRSDCVCSRALKPQGKPLTSDGRRVCPEGQQCPNDSGCVCTLDALLSWINPSGLTGSTIICPADNCTDDCLCRDDILASVKEMLYAKKGTKIIDFGPEESVIAAKDEL